MDLLFIDKVKSNPLEFARKVVRIANDLGIHPDWLMTVMGFETAYTFSPSIKNPNSTATGLIQFMEATAKELGTTTALLAKMSNVQQLDYVYRYLRGKQLAHGTFDCVADVYLAVFYPAAISKSMDWKFPDRVYRVNKVFDLNKDGFITKAEVQQKILSTIPAQYSGHLVAVAQKKTS